MIEERYFDQAAAAGAELAQRLGECLAAALARRGRAALVVTGGRTPRHVYPKLARHDLAWRDVHITLSDERWVAARHPDSNERLVRELLLTGAAADAPFTGLKTDAPTPDQGAGVCRARLEDFPLPFDAVFLGMGEDGHIASLFPGFDPADNAQGLVVPVAAPAGSHPRMSLAPAAILGARHIFVMAAGAAKLDVLDAARQPGDVGELPVRLVLHQDRVPVTLFLAKRN